MKEALDCLEREALRDARDPLRVLLAEDDEDLREALRTVLRLHGMDVSVAADAWQALDRLKNTAWDVVVCDIRLPGPSGFNVAWSARGLDPAPSVILITAYPEWHVYHEAVEAGALCVLRKPFDLHQFAELVHRAAHGEERVKEIDEGREKEGIRSR